MKKKYRGPTPIGKGAEGFENLQHEIAAASNRMSFSGEGKLRRKSEPAVQRKVLSDENEETDQRKGKGESGTISTTFQAALQSSKGQGNKMDKTTVGFMSTRFGQNFDSVKIHNNTRAHKMAADINARAFTVGQDIYFNEGEYQPHSKKGKHLLAHELTHVIQQKNEVRTSLIQRKCNVKSAKHFYSKTKMGKKIKWTSGLVEELYKVVGKVNKALYEAALKSGKIDSNFVALVCKAQEILGFKDNGVDGKIGSKTIAAWDAWKTGGKKGIDYGRLFKDKKLEIGVAVGFDKDGATRKSKALIIAVLTNPKYRLKLTLSTPKKDRYEGKRKYKVQGDNTAAPVEIQIIIDVVDFNKKGQKNTFSSFLTDSEMAIYVGHARYGTGPDFDAKSSPAENFIIGVNSALHKAGKLKKGYSPKMNKYLKGKANDLEKLSKAGKFDSKKYQVWFLNACSTIHYLDEIRGGLVADAKGKKKSKDNLRIMGTNKPVGVGSAGVILQGILEMQTMEQIMRVANKEQGGGKQRYFAD